MIVDVHAHLYPPAWRSEGRMPEPMFDVDGFLARLDEGGVDVGIVSDPHIWYGARDVTAIDSVREYNEFAAGLAARTDGRVLAMGSVVPWEGADHLVEAQRAIDDLGLVGLAVPTSDRGRYLDSIPEDFWEFVAGRGIPVFLHPGGTVLGQEFMDGYRLAEVCGRPLDTTLTLTRAILTGVLERHPGLRLLCPHGGGAICTVAARLDFGHELRDYAPLGPWGDVRLPEPPSAYVRRLWVDTVTYGTPPLRLALEVLGSDRICFGTDGPPVPFPVSRHAEVVDGLGLDHDARQAVMGGNAVRLFGLAERT